MGRPRNAVRDAALAAGQKYYLADKPCLHGHMGLRNTKSNNCVQCTGRRYRANRFLKTLGQPLPVLREPVFVSAYAVERVRPAELVTWGGPYPALMAAAWR